MLTKGWLPMLSDAIKEPCESVIRPVRVSYFDPRTGEPLDHRPEPLGREQRRATAEERNAAIAERDRGEREARAISEAMRKRAGLKPDKPRKPKKRPTAIPRLLTCPVCGTRFETAEANRIACSDECAVCGRPFEVSGKSRKLTCSDACAKARKRERELAWKAATRNGSPR